MGGITIAEGYTADTTTKEPQENVYEFTLLCTELLVHTCALLAHHLTARFCTSPFLSSSNLRSICTTWRGNRKTVMGACVIRMRLIHPIRKEGQQIKCIPFKLT